MRVLGGVKRCDAWNQYAVSRVPSTAHTSVCKPSCQKALCEHMNQIHKIPTKWKNPAVSMQMSRWCKQTLYPSQEPPFAKHTIVGVCHREKYQPGKREEEKHAVHNISVLLLAGLDNKTQTAH